ncbi:hypothetical protein ASG73_06360 [Janibacter sp. Soil728]|nr:hypothetical protein ASG73_06360 [Janibacter sp. Soil728]
MHLRSILVTGAQSSTGRQIIAALGTAGHLTHAVDGAPGMDASRLSWVTHRRHGCPAPTSAERIPALLKLCLRHHIDTVIPTLGEELADMAAASAMFAAHDVQVAVPDPRGLAMIADGLYALRALDARSIPTVWSSLPSELADGTSPGPPHTRRTLLVPRQPWSTDSAVSIFDADDFDFALIGDDHLVCSFEPPIWRITLHLSADGSAATATACRLEGAPVPPSSTQAALAHIRDAARALSLTGPIEVTVVGGTRDPRILDITPGVGPVHAQHEDLLSAILTRQPAA